VLPLPLGRFAQLYLGSAVVDNPFATSQHLAARKVHLLYNAEWAWDDWGTDICFVFSYNELDRSNQRTPYAERSLLTALNSL
jgi:hypothetical protein